MLLKHIKRTYVRYLNLVIYVMHNSIINATHAVKGPIRSVNIHLHTLWENSRDPLLLYKYIIYIINIRLNELKPKVS